MLMVILNAYKKFWTDAFDIEGRVSRSEFWYAYLGNILILLIMYQISEILGDTSIDIMLLSVVYVLYPLAAIIPSLTIKIRRMHDINKSGWLLLLALIPLVGIFIVLILLCMNSVEPNKYDLEV